MPWQSRFNHMRIIAGNLKSRLFESPHGHRTHPMSERVRGGLFNALGDITELTVFDPYAGSGALGFEALSRGAQSVMALDTDKQAFLTLLRNKKSLNFTQQFRVEQKASASWLRLNPDAQFDLVLADPPYDDLKLSDLQLVADVTSGQGTFVLSWPGGQNLPEFSGFEKVLEKDYGDAQLGFYHRTGSSS